MKCLTLQSKEYNGHISGKIGKRAESMAGQMKSAVVKPSDLIFVVSFLHNFKTTCDSNGIDEGSAIWLIVHLMKEPHRTAFS